MQISASQLKTFELCPKKWYFEKVKKLPRGEVSYGATFGSALHACLERLQKGEFPFPEGWDSTLREGDSGTVEALLSLYQPVEGIEAKNVERKIAMDVIDDIKLIGFIDLYKPGKIIDHKTTKAMRWALSAKELAKDLQMLVYAKWALDQEGPELDVVELRHNVFLRTAPVRHKKTVAYATREAIMEKWYQIQETALLMKEARSGSQPPCVEMGDQCHAYGGCPYARICSGVASLEEFEARPEKKKEEEMPKKETPEVKEDLTLFVGCHPITRNEPCRYMSLDKLFLDFLAAHDMSVSSFSRMQAFARRDMLLEKVGPYLHSLEGPVHVTAPSSVSQSPDEKSLVWAVRLASGKVVVAFE